MAITALQVAACCCRGLIGGLVSCQFSTYERYRVSGMRARTRFSPVISKCHYSEMTLWFSDEDDLDMSQESQHGRTRRCSSVRENLFAEQMAVSASVETKTMMVCLQVPGKRG